MGTGRQVAVTGIGVIAPGGVGRKQFWDLLTSGRTATRPISTFDASQFRSRIAAEVDFDPRAMGLTERQIRKWDRTTQFAIVAAREALDDSGVLDRPEPERTGVMIGTACGATISLDREFAVVSDQGKIWQVEQAHASPYLYDYFIPSSISAEVAHEANAQGSVGIVSTGCTSGIDVLSHSADLIRDGIADVMIAGASDAAISPITVACFDAIKATSSRNDDPSVASRPFENTRDGFVLGEGAAVLILEEFERAVRRGAHIYATVDGYASRCNAYSMTGLRLDGAELADAITASLTDARLDRCDIDYVNAHGSSTKMNDKHETQAFKTALGAHAYRVPVSSIKSMIGHSLGSICAIEAAACALTIDTGVIPPTANYQHPDPDCDLDYVPNVAREQTVNSVLTVASGFGGFQSAMVLSSPARAA